MAMDAASLRVKARAQFHRALLTLNTGVESSCRCARHDEKMRSKHSCGRASVQRTASTPDRKVVTWYSDGFVHCTCKHKMED